MPASYRIDPERSLLVVEARGRVTDDELMHVLRTAHDDPEFAPELKLLGDFRGADLSEVSTPVVRSLAESSLLRGRRALVLPAGVGFGIGRMYEAYASREGDAIGVFTQIEDAGEWLGMELA